MEIVFYEKPGCSGNAKQKKLLELYNISFTTKDILSHAWTQKELESFFSELPKEKIYNKFAPQIKNKALNIDALSKDLLIQKMLQDPILIKRPLLELGANKVCGFDVEKINAILKLNICEKVSIATCQSTLSCKSE